MARGVLKNDFLQIEYFTNALRVIGLTPSGKTNILADLSESPPISTPYGNFYFRGGHRLWHSPEAMPRTYIPDEVDLQITELTDGVILETPTEQGTGIRKRIEIHLSPDRPTAVLTHTLINDGLWPVELAPWCITQFRLGGTVLLPMPTGSADPAGLLPNRRFSLWPYASINDPRLKMHDDFILYRGESLPPPFKIGFFNQHGWMAYWIGDTFFRKSFQVHADQLHPDYNSNSEIYCCDEFVELESLAPLKELIPGDRVQHIETWEILDGLDSLPEQIRKLLIDEY